MKQAALLALAKRILGEELRALGFDYERGAFYRELPSGVIHIIGIGLYIRTNETFHVMCGFSSRLLYPEKDVCNMGLLGRDLHLTPPGMGLQFGPVVLSRRIHGVGEPAKD